MILEILGRIGIALFGLVAIGAGLWGIYLGIAFIVSAVVP